jgi:hypothetical protein
MNNQNSNKLTSANRCNEMIARLKSLLDLKITKQLRIHIITVISAGEGFIEKNPEAGEKFLKIFYNLFMYLQEEIKETEILSTIEENNSKARGLKASACFTEINHDGAVLAWEIFFDDIKKNKNGINIDNNKKFKP